MFSFFYNATSKDSPDHQRRAFITETSDARMIRNAIDRQTRLVKEQQTAHRFAMRQASREQVAAIEKSTAAICGTLEDGFAEMAYAIDSMHQSIHTMTIALASRLDILINEQRITNVLMGNIGYLLRIPDIQKERQYFVEEGLKHFKNGIYNEELYDDAQENLERAIQIEKTDYYTLTKLGQLYLFSPRHINIRKAEEYFTRAAKYAVAETYVDSARTKNYLRADPTKDVRSQVGQVSDVQREAVEALCYQGISRYLQGQFNRAVYSIEDAEKVTVAIPEVSYLHAKFLTAAGRVDEAIPFLDKAIAEERTYSLRTVTDLDLGSNPTIRAYLEELRRNTLDTAHSELVRIRNLQSQPHDGVKRLLYEAGQRILEDTYLTGRKALDQLREPHDFILVGYMTKLNYKSRDIQYEIDHKPPVTVSMPVVDFLERLKQNHQAYLDLQIELAKKNEKWRISTDKEYKKKVRKWRSELHSSLFSMTLAGTFFSAIFVAPLISLFFDVPYWRTVFVLAIICFVLWYLLDIAGNPKPKK